MQDFDVVEEEENKNKDKEEDQELSKELILVQYSEVFDEAIKNQGLSDHLSQGENDFKKRKVSQKSSNQQSQLYC